jgi:hypothetical protein
MTDEDAGPIRKEFESGEITWRCSWEPGGTHGSIPTARNLRGFPTVYVLDPQEVIRLKFTGHLATPNRPGGPQPPIDAFIDRLLEELRPDAGAATVVRWISLDRLVGLELERVTVCRERPLMETSTCYRCGSESVEPGKLLDSDKRNLLFSLAKFPYSLWKFYVREPLIEVAARICLDCGAIELIGDAARVRQLLGGRDSTIDKCEATDFGDLRQ